MSETAPALADYHQLADWLLNLLPLGRPRRLARMLDPGGAKYRDVPRHVPLEWAKIDAHTTGKETWAATLDQNGLSRAGVIEVDAGGRAAVVRTLGAAQQLHLTCFAIAVDNPLSGHSGGHVWFLYDAPCSVADIRAQLQQVAMIAGLGAVEIWPCAQVIRLPFGYHRWARTRGELLTQASEVLDLDSDLARGFSLVAGLPLNSAPPAIIVQSSDKLHYAKSRHVETRRDVPIAAPGARASLADVKAQFNAEHTWSELLSDYGGSETRDGWACNCGVKHNHATQIVITSQDKIVSFSPNCGWAPLKGSGRALDKFGFYVQVEHGDNITAALQALNPITVRGAAPELLDTRDEAERWASTHATELGPDYVLTPAELTRRAAAAQRKRANRTKRSQARMARIAPLAEQFAASDACPFDRDLWTYHQRRWEEKGAPEHVDSNERIARAVLGLDRTPTEVEKRRLKLAHGRLIERGYLVRTVRSKQKSDRHTNCWQPGDGYRVIRPAAETITLVEHESDSYSDSRARERRAVDPAELLERLSFASYLRNLAAELGEGLDLAELAALPLVEQEVCEARLIAQIAGGDQLQAVAFADAGDVVTGPKGAVAIVGGAAYVPIGAEAWYQAIPQAEISAPARSFDQAEPAQLLEPAPEPEPLIRCAPTEPNAAREYWALKNKKPINFKQSRWIAYRLAELEIWRPLSEAPPLEPRPLAPDRAAPLRRRRSAIACVTAPADSGQLQLTLEAPSAGGFARAVVEQSPPLTSSLGP